jgi:hypothetical protein
VYAVLELCVESMPPILHSNVQAPYLLLGLSRGWSAQANGFTIFGLVSMQ